MRIDYWTYLADCHCQECTETAFGPDALDQNPAYDVEGNPVRPVYSFEEGSLDEHNRRAAVHCGTCGTECREGPAFDSELDTFTLHYAGEDWAMDKADFPAPVLESLLECGVGGRAADPFVAEFQAAHIVTGNPDDCRAYLKGYGAWESEELADHEANLTRLVWLTAGALWESDESAYFCTY